MVKGVMVKMDVHPTGVVPAEVIFSGIEASIPSSRTLFMGAIRVWTIGH
jgi:hypothetical protein